MTNNTLCDILGIIGCLITFICVVLIFFGANCWIGAVIGIALALFAQWEYED